MLNERELENLIERVPAAPDRLLRVCSYDVQPGGEAAFESRWRGDAALTIQSCRFRRLHRDIEKPLHYVSAELWESRKAFVAAIRQFPEAVRLPGIIHQTFTEPISQILGASSDVDHAAPGQVATLRHFYLKVNQEPLFERLWHQSARAESNAPGCLYKRLQRDLNLRTHYISYSLWSGHDAPVAAANQHSHWQSEHEPYPLASRVIRSTLVIVHSVHNDAKRDGGSRDPLE